MSLLRSYPRVLAAGLGLASAACQPETPATGQAAPPAVAVPAAANPADTLHLPGGRVVQLLPSTATIFNRLPASPLPDMPHDPAA